MGCSRFCLPPNDRIEAKSRSVRTWFSSEAYRTATPSCSQCSDNQKKDLTRRANQGYNNIIARTDKARAEKSAAGFLFDEIPIGRRSHVTTPHLPARRQSVDSVPPSEPPSSPLAGTRERAGARRGRKAAAVCGPRHPGITVRAGIDRTTRRSCCTLCFQRASYRRNHQQRPCLFQRRTASTDQKTIQGIDDVHDMFYRLRETS